MDRKERFNKAYAYLVWQGKIQKQEDLAELMHSTGPNVSSALAGRASVLTDKFIIRFHAQFADIFNLDYLLNGEGELLKEQETHPCTAISSEADLLVNYARLVRQLDDLRVQAKQELAEIQSLKTEFQQARQLFTDATDILSGIIQNLSMQNYRQKAAED